MAKLPTWIASATAGGIISQRFRHPAPLPFEALELVHGTSAVIAIYCVMTIAIGDVSLAAVVMRRSLV